MDTAALWILSFFFNFEGIRTIDDDPIVLEIKILEVNHVRRVISNQTSNIELIARQKHQQRVKEVSEHIKNYYLSTVYLYSEMRKIIKRGLLMDKARSMLQLLESLEGTTRGVTLKKQLLKCFKKVKLPKKTDPIYFDNNNLVVHYAKDLYKDNFN